MVGELEESEVGNEGEEVVGGGLIGGERYDGRRGGWGGGAASGERESGRWQAVEEEAGEGIGGVGSGAEIVVGMGRGRGRWSGGCAAVEDRHEWLFAS